MAKTEERQRRCPRCRRVLWPLAYRPGRCPVCRCTFEPARRDQRYCSDACRNRASNWRHGQVFCSRACSDAERNERAHRLVAAVCEHGPHEFELPASDLRRRRRRAGHRGRPLRLFCSGEHRGLYFAELRARTCLCGCGQEVPTSADPRNRYVDDEHYHRDHVGRRVVTRTTLEVIASIAEGSPGSRRGREVAHRHTVAKVRSALGEIPVEFDPSSGRFRCRQCGTELERDEMVRHVNNGHRPGLLHRHGTRRRYGQGCRCGQCVEENRRYHREYGRRHQERPEVKAYQQEYRRRPEVKKRKAAWKREDRARNPERYKAYDRRARKKKAG